MLSFHVYEGGCSALALGQGSARALPGLVFAIVFLMSKNSAAEEVEVVREEAQLSGRVIYCLFYCLIKGSFLQQKYSLEAELSEMISVLHNTLLLCCVPIGKT